MIEGFERFPGLTLDNLDGPLGSGPSGEPGAVAAIATGDIEAHIDIVVNGKPGTAMAAFGKQLSEVDLAAVITYERNAWGNETGEMVTPKDVLDFKQAEEATQ